MLILASSSPRRKELLASSGVDFVVSPAHIDESLLPGETPQAYVLRLASSKAGAVRARMDNKADSDAWILAADTAVVVDGDILGKPAGRAEAGWMLRLLRGRAHQVFTGLALMRVLDGVLWQAFCNTDVYMRNYSDDEASAYIATGDPLDKAGGYAIQHAGFNPVSGWEGCYANVMGLPLCNLVRLLQQAGYPYNGEPTLTCEQVVGSACLVYQDWLAKFSSVNPSLTGPVRSDKV